MMFPLAPRLASPHLPHQTLDSAAPRDAALERR